MALAEKRLRHRVLYRRLHKVRQHDGLVVLEPDDPGLHIPVHHVYLFIGPSKQFHYPLRLEGPGISHHALTPRLIRVDAHPGHRTPQELQELPVQAPVHVQ